MDFSILWLKQTNCATDKWRERLCKCWKPCMRETSARRVFISLLIFKVESHHWKPSLIHLVSSQAHGNGTLFRIIPKIHLHLKLDGLCTLMSPAEYDTLVEGLVQFIVERDTNPHKVHKEKINVCSISFIDTQSTHNPLIRPALR